MDLFSMNFEHFCAQTEFFPVFSRVAGKNAVSLGCAEIRGNGGLCAPIGLHARRRESRAARPQLLGQQVLSHQGTGQLPGVSHRGGTGSVAAVKTGELGPSLPRLRVTVTL